MTMKKLMLATAIAVVLSSPSYAQDGVGHDEDVIHDVLECRPFPGGYFSGNVQDDFADPNQKYALYQVDYRMVNGERELVGEPRLYERGVECNKEQAISDAGLHGFGNVTVTLTYEQVRELLSGLEASWIPFLATDLQKILKDDPQTTDQVFGGNPEPDTGPPALADPHTAKQLPGLRSLQKILEDDPKTSGQVLGGNPEPGADPPVLTDPPPAAGPSPKTEDKSSEAPRAETPNQSGEKVPGTEEKSQSTEDHSDSKSSGSTEKSDTKSTSTNEKSDGRSNGNTEKSAPKSADSTEHSSSKSDGNAEHSSSKSDSNAEHSTRTVRHDEPARSQHVAHATETAHMSGMHEAGMHTGGLGGLAGMRTGGLGGMHLGGLGGMHGMHLGGFGRL